MEIGIFFCIIGLAVTLNNRKIVKEWKEIDKNGFKATGTVIGHEKHFKRIVGTWTNMYYPTVEYLNERKVLTRSMLKYGQSSEKPFNIGQRINVIHHNGTLYYEDSEPLNIMKFSIGIFVIGLIILTTSII